WNQDWIYRIYNDSSAYQVNVETGVESFKGFWKAVPPWRVVSFMKSGVDYTYDPDTNTYYTVGS
ncbi:MAG: hypothetical protein GY906_33610, partial [bacterium]|nr:hypothetical protein [bacterium]